MCAVDVSFLHGVPYFCTDNVLLLRQNIFFCVSLAIDASGYSNLDEEYILRIGKRKPRRWLGNRRGLEFKVNTAGLVRGVLR